MGMFDSVIGFCVKCGTEIEVQSKVGPCELECYPVMKVPAAIAADVDNTAVICHKCGRVNILTSLLEINSVPMRFR